MKKISHILKFVLVFVISLSVLSMKNVNALDLSYHEEFTYGHYSYIIKTFNNIGYVRVRNQESGEVSYITYDSNANKMYVNGVESNSVVYTENILSRSSITPTVKVNFDVNPESVGLIAGMILAVGVVATAIFTCGLSGSVFVSAIDWLFRVYSGGQLAKKFNPNASVNGYFQYAAEIDGIKCRYLNRKVFVRVGYKGGYAPYDFGTGAWFDYIKP